MWGNISGPTLHHRWAMSCCLAAVPTLWRRFFFHPSADLVQEGVVGSLQLSLLSRYLNGAATGAGFKAGTCRNCRWHG